MRYRRTRALVLIALCSLLCGCAGLAAGASVPADDDWTATPFPVYPVPPHVAVEKVPATQRAVKADLGIQVFWTPVLPDETVPYADQIFNYVVSLGANSVGINFFFYTDGPRPTRVYGRTNLTPSAATIGTIIADARRHGLRVMVRPLLNEDNLHDAAHDWRGTIKPPSASTWFDSYYGFLAPYLQAAQRNGATSFTIGAELDSLAPDRDEWTALESRAATLFAGQLDYADNFTRWQKAPAYDPVPVAAVDAYPYQRLGDNASVQQLTASWIKWLHIRPERVLHKTVLQEVGIDAAAGAYKVPSRTLPIGTPLKISVQVKWFEAACAAAKKTGLAGIYFFAVNDTDQPTHASGYRPASFIGRGDAAIKSCFASGWS